VVWDGKKPVMAYSFTIYRDGKLYNFLVPQLCGNISLRNTSEVPVPACTLNVAPAEVVLGGPVRIDMCGSQNYTKMTVTVTDAAGAVVKTMDLTPENCSAELILDKVGEYQVNAVVEGQYAMKATNPCEAVVKVMEPAPVVAPIAPVVVKANPLHFLIEGGPGVLKGTYTGMIWARVGIAYNLVFDKLDLILAVGGGIPVKGDPWKSFLMGNALLSLHAGPAYLAGGLGFSTKDCDRPDKKGGIDLVGEVGINLFRSDDSVGSIFGELRAPIITENRSFDRNHKILLGFRYIF
jgi:hypothetical protein